ncbi:hypothetical protein F7725_028543 [Dissostichus mawsoni]|uniref:Uncharacterized protein n=1 Tax=Dissostichus mawsoni TaxID=36200 RepID=A0A7J5XFZ3_DISMA|nr:hypothetical protein F7725_028543 [Dissostichus mawsoni]
METTEQAKEEKDDLTQTRLSWEAKEKKMEDEKTLLEDLYGWLDGHTVSFHFTLFSAPNLFTSVTLQTEQSPPAVLLSSARVSLLTVSLVYYIYYIYRSVIVLEVVELLHKHSYRGHVDVSLLATWEQCIRSLHGVYALPPHHDVCHRAESELLRLTPHPLTLQPPLANAHFPAPFRCCSVTAGVSGPSGASTALRGISFTVDSSFCPLGFGQQWYTL